MTTSGPQDVRLVDLAGSVSDRQAVDWETASGDFVGPGFAGLRTLARLTDAFDAENTQDRSRDDSTSLFHWGPLEVLEKIGEGQYGEVYRARDPQLARDVALKLSRSELPSSGLAEARRLARVRHPGVLTVFGAAVHDGRAGIWCDLLQGLTLEERLDRDGPLGQDELTQVGTELCRALSAVHQAGLVHGDVKTSNVVRDHEGKLVLVDFGAAYLPSEGAPAIVQATPSYLAPEVASGETLPTPESDLFALGALLHRLASGTFWRGADSNPLGDARPDLPVKLVATIESLLAERPQDRPRSAGEVARRLASALPPVRRAPHVFRLALAVFLVSALAAGWVWWNQAPPDPRPLSVRLSSLRGGVEVPLQRGSVIRPGDRLNLRLELAQPTHLYVLNEDLAGDLFVLFPLPGLSSQNPLPEGSHRLPGPLDGIEQSWEVTSAGGTETFLVIGSTAELPEVERFIASRERAQPGQAIESSRPAEETQRGVGGLGPSTPPTGQAMLQQLQETLGSDDGRLWTELLVLKNPP